MEFKKKTIIWEDNNEPPKDYIWVRSNGKAYEFSYTAREWKEIMSSSGNCSGGQSSTTEFRTIARNGKPVQESDLKEGDTVQPLYGSTYSEPHKGDLVKAKMVDGELDAEFVDDPSDYIVETYERCGETYKVLAKKIIPPNCIYYTTTSGTEITISSSILTITSNNYQNGQGVITFEYNLEGIFTEQFFKDNTDLLTVELPDGITGIGERVFSGCSGLQKVKLPRGLQSVGIKAFNGCRALLEIKLPESVNYIGEGAFRRCSSLTEVVIPDNVTALDAHSTYSGVFQDCTNLKTIILSSNTEVLGQDTFDACSSLESIYIPKEVNSIYSNATGGGIRPAFNACSGLKEIVVDPRNQRYYSSVNCEEYNGIFYTWVGGERDGEKILIRGCDTTVIPEDINTIGFAAFSGCSDFKGIELNENVAKLESWCFTMTGLESINIPKNLGQLDAWCFANCPKLSEITVDPLNQEYTSRNANGDECNCIIGTMNIGNENVRTLLVGCKTTTIPTDPDLTMIGNGAFNNQSEMTSIIIPNNITRISEDNVFNGCSALTDVTYTGTMAEFAALNGGDGWTPWKEFMVPATVVHCTDGDITKPSE